MTRLATSILLAVALATSGYAGQDRGPVSGDYLEKAAEIRGVGQGDPKLPMKGKRYCGPAAVASVLGWLQEHGYPGLAPGFSQRSKQVKVLELLGDFMGTKTGTTPYRIMNGVERYCEAYGYRARITWVGCRDGGRYQVSKRPELEWIMKGMHGRSNVILSIGFYRHDAKTHTYTLVDAHWVTAVGYTGRRGPKPYLLILVDQTPSVFRPVPLRSGRLAQYRDLPSIPAAGWLQLPDYAIPADVPADAAIIDGAFRMEVVPRKKGRRATAPSADRRPDP